MGGPQTITVAANLEKLIFLASQIATYPSPGCSRNHGSHPVNHVQIKLKDSRTWTLHHVRVRCQVVSSGNHTTMLPARFASRRLSIKCRGRGHGSRENEHCGITISLQLNSLGLSMCKKLNFRPFMSSVWPPLSPGPFI